MYYINYTSLEANLVAHFFVLYEFNGIFFTCYSVLQNISESIIALVTELGTVFKFCCCLVL